MTQPSEPEVRKQYSALLVERTIRNAVVAIEAENLQPTRDLVIQMVRMVDQMRAVPTSPSESMFATAAINQAIKQLEAGDWDEQIQTGASHWSDG